MFLEKCSHGSAVEKLAVMGFPSISSLSSLIDLLLHPIVSVTQLCSRIVFIKKNHRKRVKKSTMKDVLSKLATRTPAVVARRSFGRFLEVFVTS